VVTGAFASSAQVSRSIDDLLAAGFTSDQIAAVTASGQPIAQLAPTLLDTVNNVLHGAGLGALIGGVVGLTVGALLLPEIGAIVVVGELLTGGALTGGLIGALVKLGHREEQAEALVEQVKAGRYLVVVQPADTLRAETVLWNAGAAQVHTSLAP
jgi:outer membrane lipoprotein SlyB